MSKSLFPVIKALTLHRPTTGWQFGLNDGKARAFFEAQHHWASIDFFDCAVAAYKPSAGQWCLILPDRRWWDPKHSICVCTRAETLPMWRHAAWQNRETNKAQANMYGLSGWLDCLCRRGLPYFVAYTVSRRLGGRAA